MSKVTITIDYDPADRRAQESSDAGTDTVYLALQHGRASARIDMEEAGSEGPVIGPLNNVTIQYGKNIHLGFPPGTPDDDIRRWGLDPAFPALTYEEDCVIHTDGVTGVITYYGDVSIFSGDDE